jgi:hypothetical protein
MPTERRREAMSWLEKERESIVDAAVERVQKSEEEEEGKT